MTNTNNGDAATNSCAQRGENESKKIGAAEKPTGDLTDEQIELPPMTGSSLWMTRESRHRLSEGGNGKGAVPVHGKRSSTAIVPLYTAEQMRDYAHAAIAANLAGQSQATKVQAVPVDLRDDLQQTVSDFRKATYEFARGQDPEDHAAMMAAQKRIFYIADALAAPTAQEVTQQAATDEATQDMIVGAMYALRAIAAGADSPADTARAALRVIASLSPDVTQQAAPADDADPLDAFDPARSKLKREDWDATTRKPKVVTQQAAKAETAEQKPEHGSLADNLRIEQTDPGRWVVCVENWFPDEDKARAACRKWKTAYSSAPLVKVMVDRFLGWKLPEDFYPDAGISFDRAYAEKWGMPSGTNLFHAGQAKAMFEHVLAAPTTSTVSALDEVRDAAPVISSYDLEKVKSLKYKFVDELIHSGIQYRTCGAISAALNKIIDASENIALRTSTDQTDTDTGSAA